MLKRIVSFIITILVVLVAIPTNTINVEAKNKYEGMATLRVFSTSDLHGKSVKYSYDTGKEQNGSLAQVIKIVKEKKKSLKNGTTLLVDSGDTVYGLGATAQNQGLVSGKQYMFEIMNKVGYDAITLGNHDFDYGYSYIKKCLEETKMDKKVVLSNVVAAKTKKPTWATSRIIKKTVRTTKGKKRTLKIGITGAVTPSLSALCDTRSELVSYDIVESVRSEAKKLKKKGADVVIVLCHSGIGARYVEEMENDVSYRVARIKEVDMVCAGHWHKTYPGTDEKVKPTYSYPYVSKNGLVDGKALVEEDDRGESFGITDLKFKFVNGKAKLVSQKVSMRTITERDAEDPKVVEYNSVFDTQYQNMMNRKITTINGEIDGYFGTIEDNALIQVVNESKIHFAQKLIRELKPEYEQYPTIAATFYDVAGSTGGSDYINMTGDIQYKHILNFQSYNKEQERVYYITGAQLREELEYRAASMFSFVEDKPVTNQSVEEKTEDQLGEQSEDQQEDDQMDLLSEWSDPTMATLVNEGYEPLLSNEWQDWSNFVVFDGVEYKIDTTVAPRYDIDGNIINNTNRIKSLTLNGSSVKDDQIFTLAVDNLSKSRWAPIYEEMKKQYIINRKVQSEHMSDIISDYLEMQSPNGVLDIEPDNNWSVVLKKDVNYVVKSSINANEIVKTKPWYKDTVAQDDEYGYYCMTSDSKDKDERGPLVILASMKTEKSGDPVEIKVVTSDKSRTQSVNYVSGIATEGDSKWNEAKRITNGVFFAEDNAIYSIRATDSRGNSTIRYININNIDEYSATTPFVNAVNNKSTAITGRASSDATVYVKTTMGTYTSKADDEGYFSCEVSNLFGGKNIYVWQVDSQERKSDDVVVYVARKGANQPVLDRITNKKTSITGLLNDSSYCKVVVIKGDTVYIPKGQLANYKLTKIYKTYKKKEIKQVKYRYNSETGRFSLAVPSLYADQKVKIYSYDWIQRSSTAESLVVEDVAPNKPKIEDVVAQEGWVYGYIPKAKEGTAYTITVKCGGQKYTGSSNPDGTFGVKTDVVDTDAKVVVTASDQDESGNSRKSLETETKAISFEKIGSFEFINGHIDPINSKDTVVSGYVNRMPNQSLYLVYGSGHHEITLNEDGTFRYELNAPRKAKSKVGLISRNADGSLQTYRYTTVTLAKPDAPEMITEDIDEDTKTIKIKGVDKAEAYLMIGDVKYKASSVKKKGEKYIYTFKVSGLKPKKKIVIWLKNATGSSKKVKCGRVQKLDD